MRCCNGAVRPIRTPQRQAAITAAAAAEVSTKEGPIILDGQVLHSIEPHRLDIIRSMEKDGWVERELSKMLKPVEKSWQPADHLPDPASDTFLDEVRTLSHALIDRRQQELHVLVWAASAWLYILAMHTTNITAVD